MINQTSETTLVQGTVADVAMTVTLTDGAADIDLSSATIPRNYPGCKLTIKDSAGREIVGWIYTNGAGTVQNIVSTKGGSTRNWTYKNGSFDTTDDYTYRIDRVHVAALVHSGSMLAGLGHISTVAGTAFIDPDIGEDWSSFADGLHFLVVQDTAGRTIGGYLKAAGGGETLGDNIFNLFNFTSGWTPYSSGAVVDADTFTSIAGNYSGIYKGGAYTTGQLYKSSLTGTSSAGTVALRSDASTNYNYATMGLGDRYSTSGGTTRGYLNGSAAATHDITTLVSQPVLTPSVTGATVVSAKSGTTYNWTWTTTGFDPNGALGFKIYKIGY